MVIEPLLIDEDYYARVEGREIISNLAKAAGVCVCVCGFVCYLAGVFDARLWLYEGKRFLPA